MLNFLSVGTIMFAMFILGSFIFAAMNLKNLTLDWQEQIQFNVFLVDQITQDQVDELTVFMNTNFPVEEVVYISKESAQERFQSDFSSYTEVLESLEENPFPASFQVILQKGVDKQTFQSMKDQITGLVGVEDVFYDEEIFQRLDTLAGLISVAGWFFGSIMIFSSIFTISNVLKLTFFTRREEVDIMKLVGASRAYIRGPFIVEGILIGILGACLGVVVVFVGYLLLSYYLSSRPDLLVSSLDLSFLPTRWVGTLVLAGGLSGLLGSLVSLHQFLEEHISYQ